MTAGCPDCGETRGIEALDLGFNIHGHTTALRAVCPVHGEQPLVLVRAVPFNRLVCQPCWTSVWATANAFTTTALNALANRYLAPVQPVPSGGIAPARPAPDTPDFAAMRANIAAGLCWCGRIFIGGAYDQISGDWRPTQCFAGHAYQAFPPKPSSDGRHAPGGP